MDRRTGVLDWAVATAPLLGILGTGIGIAVAFRQNGRGLPDPGALGQGISLALQTTIWGLSISILAATARAVFHGVRRRATRRIESLIELVDHARDEQTTEATKVEPTVTGGD
jgi:biopolymer transport protein ExbB/TolQ